MSKLFATFNEDIAPGGYLDGLSDCFVAAVSLALILGPVLAIYGSSLTPGGFGGNYQSALLLLWAVQIAQGLGEDPIDIHYGYEADWYLAVLALIKTLLLLDNYYGSVADLISTSAITGVSQSSTGEIVWLLPILGAGLYMLCIRNTVLRTKFLDDAVLVPPAHRDFPARWRLALVFAVVGVTLGNAVAFYVESDTTATVLSVAEAVVAGALMVRLGNFQMKTEIWQGGGAIVLVYAYYQIVGGYALGWIHLVLNLSAAAAAVLIGLKMSAQVNAEHDANGKAGTSGSSTSIVSWLLALGRGALDIALNPLTLRVVVLLCAMVVVENSFGTGVWYTGDANFPSEIQTLACTAIAFSDNDIQAYFTFTGSTDFQTAAIAATGQPLVGQLMTFAGKLRVGMAKILRASYQDLNDGCSGYQDPVGSSGIGILLPLVFIAVAFANLMCVFPKARAFLMRPGLWVVSMIALVFALVSTLTLADTKSLLFSLIVPGVTYSRTYTSSGATVFAFSTIAIAACIALIAVTSSLESQHITSAKDAARGGKPNAVVGAVVSVRDQVESVVARIVKPSVVFLVLGGFFFFVAVLSGSPFASFGVVPPAAQLPYPQCLSQPSSLPYPCWVDQPSLMDVLVSDVNTLDGLVTEAVEDVLGVNLISQLAADINYCYNLNLGVTSVNICVSDIIGDLISFITDIIQLIAEGIADVAYALLKAVGFFNIGIFNSVLALLPQITALDGFNLLDFNLSLNGFDLSSVFSAPPAVAWGMIGVVALVVVFGVLFQAYPVATAISQAVMATLSSCIVSVVLWAVNVVQVVEQSGYTVSVGYNWSLVPLYGLAVLFLVMGVFLTALGDSSALASAQTYQRIADGKHVAGQRAKRVKRGKSLAAAATRVTVAIAPGGAQ